jgi:hypothetical protein
VARRSEEYTKTKIEEIGKLLISQANIRNFFKTYFVSQESKWVADLKFLNMSLIKAILKTSNKTCICDSSKEYTRALFLARFFPEAKIIHLVRNPEDILFSYLKRINKGEPIKILRKIFYPRKAKFLFLLLISMTWGIGNIFAEIVRLSSHKKVLLVRYEDLCDDLSHELKRISKFVGCPVQNILYLIENGQPFIIHNSIGGNRMRFQKKFMFEPKLDGKTYLPATYRIFVRLINFPFLFYYNYI